MGVNPKKLNSKDPKSYCGNYYAFGEIEPKKEYTWETYKFFDHIDKLSNGLENHFVTIDNIELSLKYLFATSMISESVTLLISCSYLSLNS